MVSKSSVAREWVAEIVAHVRTMAPGTEVYALPPDCRGDGYDIADKPRPNLVGQLRTALQDRGVAAAVGVIRLKDGPVAGYHIRVPQGEMRLAQHSGNWGPWYHISEYQGSKFLRRLGGHYNWHQARALGLPFGRPSPKPRE